MARGSRLRWSPDGRWIAVSYSGPALDIVDPEGNQRRRLLDANAHFAWSADSKAIYYLDGNVLRRLAIESAEAAVLSNGVRWFDVSRDESIALAIGAPGGCIVRLVKDQETIDRQRLQFGGECTTIAWSRDGSKLLVGVLTSPYEPAQLWVMDADHGPPKLISVPTEMISSLSLGADGKTLLFSAGNPFPESWLVSGIGRRGAEPLAAETSDKEASLVRPLSGSLHRYPAPCANYVLVACVRHAAVLKPTSLGSASRSMTTR
jgi:Tol biopolymer transport system component